MTNPRESASTRTAESDDRFGRVGGRLRFTARRGRVVDVRPIAPALLRVRVTGPDFDDFVSSGPTDHVRLFVPDPHSGELIAPVAVGPDADGIIRPDRPAHGRDMTPALVESGSDGVTVSLDIYQHPDPGPVSAWASSAAVGDRVVLVGPRGTKSVPSGINRLVLIVDETALPSAARWAREVPFECAVDVIAFGDDVGEWVERYVAESAGRGDVAVRTLGPADDLLAVVRSALIDDDTFVFAAGEATALVPIRRWLRAERLLPARQFQISGYWKRGESAFDHHAPLDPSDPDGDS